MSNPIAGILTSFDSDTVNNNVGEWMFLIAVKEARGQGSGATLMALTALMSTEKAEAPEYNWFVRDTVRRTVYSSAAEADTAATVLSFDDSDGNAVNAYLTSGVVLENRRTGEYVRTVADSTGATATVVRAQGGTAAAAVLDDDTWRIVTFAAEEGTGSRRAIYEAEESVTNYLQEFKATADLTRLIEGSNLRSTDSQRKEARNVALEVISNDIEGAFLDGRKGSVAGPGGKRMYLTGGVRDGITRAGLAATNITSGNGASGIELGDFTAWIEKVLLKGSGSRLALAGPEAYSAISRYANSAAAGFRIEGSYEEFGMAITQINTPRGTVHLTVHQQMANETERHGDMYLIDLKNIKQKIGSKITIEEDIQIPGTTRIQDQFLAHLGIMQTFADPFGYISDLTKIIPDA